MLYEADFISHQIRQIDSQGNVSGFAGSGDAGDRDGPSKTARFFGPVGIAYDSRNGYLYVTDSGNNEIREIHPDGSVKTIAGNHDPGDSDGLGDGAHFSRPTGITYDAADDVLYVADSGNALIRRVTISGNVATIHAHCVASAEQCWDSTR
jgi:DNA-binding beta-propeller fold protein YncE